MAVSLRIFTGSAHPALAQAIANHMGMPVGAAVVDEFRNGETRVVIEENVRGADVFVVQPTESGAGNNAMRNRGYGDQQSGEAGCRIWRVGAPPFGSASIGIAWFSTAKATRSKP